jgi:hypothetical protein
MYYMWNTSQIQDTPGESVVNRLGSHGHEPTH